MAVHAAVIGWKPKHRKCKHCGERFHAVYQIVWWCSPECGYEIAKDKILKARRADTKERKKALETKRNITPKAQQAFNAFIRARDYGLPCISCGRNDGEVSAQSSGGTWDCGHYRSVGSAPELRFEPLNAHRQCKQCNRDKSGNHVEYRRRLIERIGIDAVEWLEGPHELKRYTIDELREIARHYRAEARRLDRCRHTQ